MSIKSYAAEPMPEVTVKTYGDTIQVQIYLNGKRVASAGDEQEVREQLEYDFNEIRAPIGTLDIEDIQLNPAKYLDYDFDDVSARIERLKAELAKSDHIDNKLIEGVVTREQVADKIAEREALRREIRKLLGEPAPYDV